MSDEPDHSTGTLDLPDLTLSIIVPVLNEASTLRVRLEALDTFRDRGAQLVVVDGGSSDATASIAAPIADVATTAPRGRASQMNAGARIASGDVLLFLHADTELPPAADRLIAAGLAEGHDWGRFDVRIDSPRLMLAVVSRMMNERSHLSGIVTGDQGIFVRRQLFERVGGFPELPLMEDVAVSKILRRHGRPARIRTPVVTSGRRWETRGTWRTITLMWRTRLDYFFGADPAALAVRYGYAPHPQPSTPSQPSPPQ